MDACHKRYLGAFAKELYHLFCQQDIPVFNKLRQGVDKISSSEARALQKAFGRTTEHFYKKSLMPLVENALNKYSDLEALVEQAKTFAELNKENAIPYFLQEYNYFVNRSY